MISNDVLDFARPIELVASARDFEPWRVVLHYSAGSTLQSARRTLNERELGYHVLIDLDGKAYQSRPFTKTVAHAGRSNWKAAAGVTNTSSLNNDAIGVCLVNLGQFGYFNNGVWYYGYDRATRKYLKPSVADADANKAALIYTPENITHWTAFTPAQFATAERVLGDLVETYHIEEIVGHQDVAIDQKPDPGPLCPLEEWRRAFGKQGSLGLRTTMRSPDGKLGLRQRPSGNGRVVTTLHNGDEIHVRAVTYTSAAKGIIPANSDRALSAWASIDIDGSNRHAGFVHMKYLARTPLAPEYQAALKD